MSNDEHKALVRALSNREISPPRHGSTVVLRMEPKLLERLDGLAREHNVTRSEVIRECLWQGTGGREDAARME